MEAKSFLHCHSTAPQIAPHLCPTSLHPPSIQSHKCISCKTNFSSKLVSCEAVLRKRLLCRNRLGIDPVVEGDGSGNQLRVKNLAVFVSGGGSNFRSIHEAVMEGSILGRISVLVTNKPGCGGAVYARDNGIPVILFPGSSSLPNGLSAVDLVTSLREYDIDFILLAGFLKLIPAELVRAYPRRIVNIHPSLLPAFGGKGYFGFKVHEAVIASGARYSGPTIHFVDEHYDTGRILAQRVVPVLANDTAEVLAARVLQDVRRFLSDL